MRIRIVQIPPGQAPEHIREQWLGVEMPAQNEMDNGEEGALRIGRENVGGFKVTAKEALDALKTAGKTEAVEFWEPFLSGTLIFKAHCCEIVE